MRARGYRQTNQMEIRRGNSASQRDDSKRSEEGKLKKRKLCAVRRGEADDKPRGRILDVKEKNKDVREKVNARGRKMGEVETPENRKGKKLRKISLLREEGGGEN